MDTRQGERTGWRWRGMLLALGLGACLVAAAGVRADTLPTHGANVHWDPYGNGPVANGGGCGGAGAIVPPMSFSVVCPLGTDQTNAPAQPWHWETELDFLGLVGVFPVSVNGGPFVPTQFGPGVDVYLDFHQDDLANSFVLGGLCLPGAGEVSQGGGVCKQLFNLTQIPVAWGTSVTEDGPLAPPPGPSMSSGSTIVVSRTASGGFVIYTVPEGAMAACLGLGLAALSWWRRRVG